MKNTQLVEVVTKIDNIRVIDGDTIECDMEVYIPKFNAWVGMGERQIRLDKIQTPERSHHGFKEATERLKELIGDGEGITYEFTGEKGRLKGGFGRLLITFYDKTGENINQRMIAEGFATEYRKK